MLLASSGERRGRLLNTLQGTAQPPNSRELSTPNANSEEIEKRCSKSMCG